jgi:hypothetical protein
LALTGAGARKVVYTTLAALVEITERRFAAANAIRQRAMRVKKLLPLRQRRFSLKKLSEIALILG